MIAQTKLRPRINAGDTDMSKSNSDLFFIRVDPCRSVAADCCFADLPLADYYIGRRD